MTFKQLARQYFEAVEILDKQIEERESELDKIYHTPRMSRRVNKLSKEISVLTDMRDEALNNAYYLDNYYREDDSDAGKN